MPTIWTNPENPSQTHDPSIIRRGCKPKWTWPLYEKYYKENSDYRIRHSNVPRSSNVKTGKKGKQKGKQKGRPLGKPSIATIVNSYPRPTISPELQVLVNFLDKNKDTLREYLFDLASLSECEEINKRDNRMLKGNVYEKNICKYFEENFKPVNVIGHDIVFSDDNISLNLSLKTAKDCFRPTKRTVDLNVTSIFGNSDTAFDKIKFDAILIAQTSANGDLVLALAPRDYVLESEVRQKAQIQAHIPFGKLVIILTIKKEEVAAFIKPVNNARVKELNSNLQNSLIREMRKRKKQ
jgi:hypothetical protein